MILPLPAIDAGKGRNHAASDGVTPPGSQADSANYENKGQWEVA